MSGRKPSSLSAVAGGASVLLLIALVTYAWLSRPGPPLIAGSREAGAHPDVFNEAVAGMLPDGGVQVILERYPTEKTFFIWDEDGGRWTTKTEKEMQQ